VDLSDLTHKTRALKAEQFAEQFGGRYLVISLSQPDRMIEYRTELVVTRANVPTTRAVITDVAALEKTDRNPYSSRILVGRSRNCDIILRASTVSKVHAHFEILDDQKLELVDLNSQNGVVVNGRRLEKNIGKPISIDDVIVFGAVPTALLDGAGLYKLLKGS
jgi:hypothetical protein